MSCNVCDDAGELVMHGKTVDCTCRAVPVVEGADRMTKTLVPNEEQLCWAREAKAEMWNRNRPEADRLTADEVDQYAARFLAEVIAVRDAKLLADALRPFEELAAQWHDAGDVAFQDREHMVYQDCAAELRAAIEQARSHFGSGR